MVTRRNPNPAVEGFLNADQAISVEQAITAFTSGPAESMGLGDVTGRLKVGYSADFIVLDRDLFEVDTALIHQTRVLRTYFAGRLVHSASSANVGQVKGAEVVEYGIGSSESRRQSP